MKPWRPSTFNPKAMRYYRQQAGLRQLDLAVKLGMSPDTIESWETGNTVPTVETLLTMSKVLDCRFDSLFGPPPKPPVGLVTARINAPIPPPPSPKCYVPGLRALREQRGMSQWKLAHLVGTHGNQVRLWEKCKVKPSPPMLARLATALGVEPDALTTPHDPEIAPK